MNLGDELGILYAPQDGVDELQGLGEQCALGPHGEVVGLLDGLGLLGAQHPLHHGLGGHLQQVSGALEVREGRLRDGAAQRDGALPEELGVQLDLRQRDGGRRGGRRRRGGRGGRGGRRGGGVGGGGGGGAVGVGEGLEGGLGEGEDVALLGLLELVLADEGGEGLAGVSAALALLCLGAEEGEAGGVLGGDLGLEVGDGGLEGGDAGLAVLEVVVEGVDLGGVGGEVEGEVGEDVDEGGEAQRGLGDGALELLLQEEQLQTGHLVALFPGGAGDRPVVGIFTIHFFYFERMIFINKY